jgi:hypothetical protein
MRIPPSSTSKEGLSHEASSGHSPWLLSPAHVRNHPMRYGNRGGRFFTQAVIPGLLGEIVTAIQG